MLIMTLVKKNIIHHDNDNNKIRDVNNYNWNTTRNQFSQYSK